MIAGYLRLLFLLPGVLLGTQIPAVIDGYTQRADAHLIEVKRNFSGFQQTANRHFSGDIDALIRHYERSPDPIFRDDAESIRQIYLRLRQLTALSSALNAGRLSQLQQLLAVRETVILDETLTAHIYTIPLTTDALLFGLAVGLLLLLLLEATVRIPLRLIRRSRRRKPPGKKVNDAYNSSM